MKLLTCLILIICLGTGCAHHPTSDAAKKLSGTVSMEDKLPGVWHITKTEIPSFGTQDAVDAFTQKMAPFRSMMTGLAITFSKDHTYSATLNGNTDTGTWKMSDQNHLEMASKMLNTSTVFQIISNEENTLLIKYIQPEGQVLVTVVKQ